MPATEVIFGVHVVAPAKRGRFTLAPDCTVTAESRDGVAIARVGYGIPRNERDAPSLVYERGDAQSAIPTGAVAIAVASGKVIPMDALVQAFKDSGTLDKLVKAVEKATA